MSHASSTLEMNPGTSTTSRGPSPETWYAMWTSPLLAYRVSGITTASLHQLTNRVKQLPGAITPFGLSIVHIEICD